MTGVTDAGSTRLLLAGPAVARTLLFALLGRLAYGVLPLCFLFTVRDATGSFTTAAAASGLVGLGTLAMPLQSRLVDRHGQRRVLPAYAAAYGSLLVLAAALAQGSHAAALWLGLGLALGLSGPALGPATRAQWREIAPEGPMRRRAYSLDSVAEESLYLLGPVVAGGILTTGRPWLGLLVAGVLLGCGTTALVCSPYRPAVEPAPAPGRADRRPLRGPLRHRGFLGLLAVMALFGAGGAAAFVGIAALADRAGTPGAAGLVEAAMATGAVLGGLAWARLGGTGAPGRLLVALLLPVAAAQALTAVAAPHLVLVGVVVAVGALATSPVFVVAFSGADAAVPARERTEASTWVTVGTNLGVATGTAVAGLMTGSGAAAPFWLAAGLTVAAALAAPVVRTSGQPTASGAG